MISLFISIVLFISFSSFINYGFKSADLYYGESFIPFDLAVTLYDGSPKDLESFSTQVAALDGVERCAVIREAVAESWLEGAQFGPYIQKNFIDQKLFPVNEAGRYQCTFRLVALGEDEFNAYAAANGLAAEAFKDTQNFRGILINKDILQERGTYAEYEPLHLKAGETLRLAAAEIPGDPEDPEITPPGFAMEIGAVTAAFPLGVFSAGLGAVNLVVSEELFNEICSLIQEKNEHQVELRDPMRTIIWRDSAAVAEQSALFIRSFQPLQHLFFTMSCGKEEMNRTATVIPSFLRLHHPDHPDRATNIFNTISTNAALRCREFEAKNR